MRALVEASPLWWRILASPLSGLYRIAVATRNTAYGLGWIKAERLPGKVLSVGNIQAGGTGKSPVVIALAGLLQRRGLSPAILTRGYGGGLAPHESVALLAGQVKMLAPEERRLPDEALMQSWALPGVPVIVGADRAQAARRFLAEHPKLAPTHWILDDGFQHRRLARDVDIVLLDATHPFGRGRGTCLPAGILREPPAALGRADLVLFTRSGEMVPKPEDLAALDEVTDAPRLAVPFVTSPPLGSVDDRQSFDPASHFPAFLVTGIAAPKRLEELVVHQLGIPLAGVLSVPDHRPIDRLELLRKAHQARAILTTAKDYWRDPRIFANLPQPVFVLRLTVEWSEEEVARAIASVL